MKTVIPFTQFLRPDGERRHQMVTLEVDLNAKVKEIIAAGYRFEAEILMTEEVSVTVSDPVEEIDVGIEVCQNGPAVLVAVEKLIREVAIVPMEQP